MLEPWIIEQIRRREEEERRRNERPQLEIPMGDERWRRRPDDSESDSDRDREDRDRAKSLDVGAKGPRRARRRRIRGGRLQMGGMRRGCAHALKIARSSRGDQADVNGSVVCVRLRASAPLA